VVSASSSKLLDRRGYQLLDLALPGNVDVAVGPQAAAHGFVAARVVDVAAEHVGSLGGEHAGDLATESRPDAGHDRAASL
jgi:hypothetical protein